MLLIWKLGALRHVPGFCIDQALPSSNNCLAKEMECAAEF